MCTLTFDLYNLSKFILFLNIVKYLYSLMSPFLLTGQFLARNTTAFSPSLPVVLVLVVCVRVFMCASVRACACVCACVAAAVAVVAAAVAAAVVEQCYARDPSGCTTL
jgi:hypothetical protein